LKIFIDDPVKRMDGVKEKEIYCTHHIRFEIGNKKFTCHIDEQEQGLSIYTTNLKGKDKINIIPQADNKIIVK
jgi:hypothetical protein